MTGGAIFIGYRRDDTADVAGRLYDALTRRFGRARIFKDVDNIPPGVDFGRYISDVLPRCRVALILIGPNWAQIKDGVGDRRLDDPQDWVRLEVESALASKGLLVVPVLVNGARLPQEDQLPSSLRPLLALNAAALRRDPDFHDDVARLTAALSAQSRFEREGPTRWRFLCVLLSGLLFCAAFLFANGGMLLPASGALWNAIYMHSPNLPFQPNNDPVTILDLLQLICSVAGGVFAILAVRQHLPQTSLGWLFLANSLMWIAVTYSLAFSGATFNGSTWLWYLVDVLPMVATAAVAWAIAQAGRAGRRRR
jgi:hypothetical protein